MPEEYNDPEEPSVHDPSVNVLKSFLIGLALNLDSSMLNGLI